ncbi:MAG: hypothetical protein IPO67_22405 [Deltaproteobacteria bacterium]|jgi:hypothetical protein|nr:hypothetical protein [Deltaproteobacteria bacterium]MBK9369922.1 hypothetical protein [Deltaproteobacteria bacterium]MBK9647870.1 hypothetical protein [Deltaproteobacteria bacterium]
MILTAFALSAVTSAAELRLDRVDLISEDTGAWINYEAPGLLAYPTRGAVRYVTQVKPVLALPVEHLYLGLSIHSQSLVYERPFVEGSEFTWSAGLQSALFFPRGALAGVAWRHGPVRLAVGVSAVSGGTWARPGGVAQWDVLPTVGVGLVRKER